MISGNHSHYCRVCSKAFSFRTTTGPGRHYNDKAELAHALREAIRAVEEVKKLDGNYSGWDDTTLTTLRKRLEQAEYVGD